MACFEKTKIRRAWNKILLALMQSPFLDSKNVRPFLARMAGVDLPCVWNHIGERVILDSLHPENIHIGECTAITMGGVILTHYIDVRQKDISHYYSGHVYIGHHCFLGAGVIISAPVTIGHDSVVAAGSVVTKDIPPCEVWGGVPAKFIRRRECYNNSTEKNEVKHHHSGL